MRVPATASPVQMSIAKRIWERYQEANPRDEMEYLAWVAQTATDLGTTENHVRNIVAGQVRQFHVKLNNKIETQAQQVANLLGAGLVVVTNTLLEATQATVKKPLLDKSGRPVINEDGTAAWWEVPDWPARIAACRELKAIHGANAPQQVNVDVHDEKHIYHHLSSAELEQRMNEAIREYHSLASEIEGSGSAPGRGVRPEGGRGPLLLADPGDKDERRARPSEPL